MKPGIPRRCIIIKHMLYALCVTAVALVSLLPAGDASARRRKKGKKKPVVLVVPDCSPVAWQRDWQKAPAVVAIKDPTRALYAISDVHGELNNTFDLLRDAKVLTGNLQDFTWSADNGILVVAGDSINVGISSVAVIDLWIKLEKQAALAGGAVHVLAGNHEMAFLADPSHKLFRTIHTEMIAGGRDLCKDFYAPDTRYGAWLRERPAAALINGIFISHTGATQEMSLEAIETAYKQMVDAGNWDSAFACGSESDGFFNEYHFWVNEQGRADESEVDAELALLGAKQILFGHDPQAFGTRRAILGYFGNSAGRAVIKLDTAMFTTGARGSLYKCSDYLADGGCRTHEVLTSLLAGTDPALAKFSPLTIRNQLPPKAGALSDHSDWCIGSGRQRKMKIN